MRKEQTGMNIPEKRNVHFAAIGRSGSRKRVSIVKRKRTGKVQ
jgi:hypothetical protein